MGLSAHIEKIKKKCKCMIGNNLSYGTDLRINVKEGSQAFKDEVVKRGLNKPHDINKGEWMLRINGYQTQSQICMKCPKCGTEIGELLKKEETMKPIHYRYNIKSKVINSEYDAKLKLINDEYYIKRELLDNEYYVKQELLYKEYRVKRNFLYEEYNSKLKQLK